MPHELPRPDLGDTPEMWSAIEARIRQRTATPAVVDRKPGPTRLHLLTERLTPAAGVLAVVVALMVSVSTLQTPGALAPTTTAPAPDAVAGPVVDSADDSSEPAPVGPTASRPVPLAAHLPEADAMALQSERPSETPLLTNQRFR